MDTAVVVGASRAIHHNRDIRRRVVMADIRPSNRGMVVDILLSKVMEADMARRDSMAVGMDSSRRRRNMDWVLEGVRRWGWEGGCWGGCCLVRRWMGGMVEGMEGGMVGVMEGGGMMVGEGIFRGVMVVVVVVVVVVLGSGI